MRGPGTGGQRSSTRASDAPPPPRWDRSARDGAPLPRLPALGGGFQAAPNSLLVPFAAGNFVYIAASDLVPEVKHSHGVRDNVIHRGAMVGGIMLLYLLRVALER